MCWWLKCISWYSLDCYLFNFMSGCRQLPTWKSNEARTIVESIPHRGEPIISYFSAKCQETLNWIFQRKRIENDDAPIEFQKLLSGSVLLPRNSIIWKWWTSVIFQIRNFINPNVANRYVSLNQTKLLRDEQYLSPSTVVNIST